MESIDISVKKDIQYLLFLRESQLDNIGINAWTDKKFVEIANKYGFTKDNLYKGLEEFCC